MYKQYFINIKKTLKLRTFTEGCANMFCYQDQLESHFSRYLDHTIFCNANSAKLITFTNIFSIALNKIIEPQQSIFPKLTVCILSILNNRDISIIFTGIAIFYLLKWKFSTALCRLLKTTKSNRKQFRLSALLEANTI